MSKVKTLKKEPKKEIGETKVEVTDPIIYEIDMDKFKTLEDVIALIGSWGLKLSGTKEQLKPVQHFIKLKEDDKNK